MVKNSIVQPITHTHITTAVNNNVIVLAAEDRNILVAEKTDTEIIAQGIPGLDGSSAYEIAVENGFKGSKAEWLESLKGKSFEYEDFTEEQLNDLMVRQPPLDPSPVELFNIAFEG